MTRIAEVNYGFCLSLQILGFHGHRGHIKFYKYRKCEGQAYPGTGHEGPEGE